MPVMTQKLACPHCGQYRSRVIDSRPVADLIWRRRQCEDCHAKFSTEEKTCSTTTSWGSSSAIPPYPVRQS